MTPAELRAANYRGLSHSVCRLTLTTKDPNKQAELIGEVRIFAAFPTHEWDKPTVEVYIQSSDGKAWIEVPLDRLLGIEAVPVESSSGAN